MQPGGQLPQLVERQGEVFLGTPHTGGCLGRGIRAAAGLPELRGQVGQAPLGAVVQPLLEPATLLVTGLHQSQSRRREFGDLGAHLCL